MLRLSYSYRTKQALLAHTLAQFVEKQHGFTFLSHPFAEIHFNFAVYLKLWYVRWFSLDTVVLKAWTEHWSHLCLPCHRYEFDIYIIYCVYPRRRMSRGRVFTSVCLSVFPYDISKTDAQLRPPSLIQKCPTISPEKPLILLSEYQTSRSRVIKHCRRGSLNSTLVNAGFF